MQLPRIIIASVALLGTLFFTGCAFVPQNVAFKHDLTLTGSSVGEGRALSLSVKDERADTALGHRGAAYGAAASITTTDYLDEVVKDKFASGLRQLGFKIDPQAEKKVVVELRLLSYGTSTGFWTGGIETKGAVKVVVVTNSNDRFDKNYHVDNEERVMVVPTAEHNTELLNKVLNDTVSKALADQELITFLTR